MSYDKKAVRDFCDRWRDKGYEKGETQQFWLQALRAIGYQHADDVLFEHHLPSGGFIDVWIRDANVLIEQKSYGVNLDNYEVRQNKKKTPLMQALDYVDELPRLEQPRFVVTCNFGKFRVYDRDKWSKSQLSDNAFEFTLDEFAEHPEYMSFITDPGNSRLEKEKQVSIKAGELIGKLYDMMREGYFDPDSEKSMHALNVLCVRLVFCLYCEDADLFVKDSFFNYLQNVPANQLRIALKRLFKALDTNLNDRDPYDVDVKIFPYVNGGLFREETEIPNFTEESKQFLLEEVSAAIDWSQISPTIFGGIFESTLNPETRRSGGMHYTSPENIHKVIDPLFLDDLKREFAAIRDGEGLTPRRKKSALARFHAKLCGLKFFDPACGSGNFLTETYICLRKLEDAVLRELHEGQARLGFANEEDSGVRVSLSQFYGIEINDFAVTVAESALWISRLKANGETAMLLMVGEDDFPLRESAHITHANALRINWDNVLPASECSYIMGNPPFVGHQWRTLEQQDDMALAFEGYSKYGKLDYVCAWYAKSFAYLKGTRVKAALVSTNSICQGESVQILWGQLSERGLVIDFAWPSFKWINEASDQAGVAVVIVGFSDGESNKDKIIYYGESESHVKHINGYLVGYADIYIQSRSKPVNEGSPEMTKGSQPTDGGSLILNKISYDSLLSAYPELAAVVRPYMGGDEFINSRERWCLWFEGVDIERYKQIPEIQKRLDAVRETRLKSPTASVRKDAETPWLFTQRRQPVEVFMAIPEVSSENRQYIPVGFVDPYIIASNQLRFVPTSNLYLLGLTLSKAHMAWMRVVSGRLESRYRYSPAVWNSFVWPNSTFNQRMAIEACAQIVLDVRNSYPDKSLADLYDPTKMPADLLAAHEALDKAVETAYGIDFNGDEEKIVAHLFKLYAEAIG